MLVRILLLSSSHKKISPYGFLSIPSTPRPAALRIWAELAHHQIGAPMRDLKPSGRASVRPGIKEQ